MEFAHLGQVRNKNKVAKQSETYYKYHLKTIRCTNKSQATVAESSNNSKQITKHIRQAVKAKQKVATSSKRNKK